MTRCSARLLTIMVLLTGLFAMHALASDHNGMSGMSLTSGTTVGSGHMMASPPPSDPADTQATHGLTAQVAAVFSSVGTRLAGGGTSAAHPLCLAVLAVSVLLLLAGLLRRRQQARTPRVLVLLRIGPTVAAAARLFRPPDLITELCVSRT
jgi:hypothetical protein